MKNKLVFLFSIFIIVISNCTPTMRSAKIKSGNSFDCAVLPFKESNKVNGENTDTRFDFPLTPINFKIRYGWERKKYFGFEINTGLDGTTGIYAEMPGIQMFHWGIGAEINYWYYLNPRLADSDGILSKYFLGYYNNIHLLAGYFPSKQIEISLGIKYCPSILSYIEEISGAKSESVLPLLYMIDVRYRFSEHYGFLIGTEIINQNYISKPGTKVTYNRRFIYFGITYQ